MADPIFPYETRLNILYQPLELIDIPKFVETVDFKWLNQTLCKVNDSVVRSASLKGNSIGTNMIRMMSSFMSFPGGC